MKWEVGSPASGWDDVAGWWDVGGERGSPFIVKYEALLLVGTPTEAFVLVGVWTMSFDWSGYEAEPYILIGQSWIRHPDWSELEDWKYVNWTVNCDWSELDDWKYGSWTMSFDWSELCWVNPASWLAKTNYVLIKLLCTMYLDYVLGI